MKTYLEHQIKLIKNTFSLRNVGIKYTDRFASIPNVLASLSLLQLLQLSSVRRVPLRRLSRRAPPTASYVPTRTRSAPPTSSPNEGEYETAARRRTTSQTSATRPAALQNALKLNIT